MRKIGISVRLTLALGGAILLVQANAWAHYEGQKCTRRGRPPTNADCKITTKSVSPLVESCVDNDPKYKPPQDAEFKRTKNPNDVCGPEPGVSPLVSIILAECKLKTGTGPGVVDYKCIQHLAGALPWIWCKVHK